MLYRRLLLLLLLAGPAAAGEWFVDSTADHADAALDGECRTLLGACTWRAALDEAQASPGDDWIHLPAGSFIPGRRLVAGVITRGAGADATEVELELPFDAPGIHRLENLSVSSRRELIVAGSTLVCERVRLQAAASRRTLRVESGRFELLDGELRGADLGARAGQLEWTGVEVLDGEVLIERSLIGGIAVWHDAGAGDTSSVILRSLDLLGGRTVLRNSTVLGNDAFGSFDYGAARAFGARVWAGAELVLSHATFEGSRAAALEGRPGGAAFAESATLEWGLTAASVIEHSVLLASRIGLHELVPVCLAEATLSGPSWIEELDPGCEAGSDPSLILGPGDPALDVVSQNGGFNDTRSPLPGSPLIDAGDAAFCASEDQRGIPRPQGAGCDLGAVEVSCGGVEFDRDADGICNDDDICPDAPDTEQLDSDGDGHGDACDACPGVADPDQSDADADGLGDACDSCPREHDPSGRDSDGDGLGDACECAPNDAADTELRPPVIADLRVSKTADSPVELRWTDPLVPSGSFSWAYDLAGGPLRGDRWSFGCLKDDHPDQSIEQALAGSRWWSVRAATSCAGAWGQPALDDAGACP